MSALLKKETFQRLSITRRVSKEENKIDQGSRNKTFSSTYS